MMASVKVWLEKREPVLLLLSNTTIELPLPLSFIQSRPTGHLSFVSWAVFFFSSIISTDSPL